MLVKILSLISVIAVVTSENDVSQRLDRLESSVSQLQTNIRSMLEHKDMISKKTGTPATHLEDPVYICGGQTATLSCNSTTVIELETAEYGTYSSNCATCCTPDIADCTQNMAQSNFDEWQTLNTGCDGVQTCTYTFTNQNIPFCGLNSTADYLHIFYSCTTAPTQTQEFIGFSAYAGSDQVGSGTVEFSQVLTNEGNHFNSILSRFTCPVSGFYYFFINLQLRMDASFSYDICYTYIRQDGINIALAENDDEVSTTDVEIMMSTSVVTECPAGGVITVETTYSECYIFGSTTNPWSNFGGYYIGA